MIKPRWKKKWKTLDEIYSFQAIEFGFQRVSKRKAFGVELRRWTPHRLCFPNRPLQRVQMRSRSVGPRAKCGTAEFGAAPQSSGRQLHRRLPGVCERLFPNTAEFGCSAAAHRRLPGVCDRLFPKLANNNKNEDKNRKNEK